MAHHPKKYATTTRKDGETITIFVFSCSCIDPTHKGPLKKNFLSRNARDGFARTHGKR